MLLSIALILLSGMAIAALFKKIGLPHIIGMLIVGILLGPHCLNLLDENIMLISADLRQIALIIILLKAGLSLDINVLKKVGRPAFLLCFVPATCEIIAYLLIGPKLLGVSLLEAGLIGAVMGAVSPAVVIPAMSRLMDNKWGTEKGIPQMIIAGASADDVYVIVVFTTMLSMVAGGKAKASDFVGVPISIVLGICLGIVSGLLLVLFFKKVHMRDTVKVLILLSVSFLFVSLENALEGIVPVSGLLAVMAMGITIYNRYEKLAKRVMSKFNKLWVAAEVFLFVLVGSIVNVEYALSAGLAMIIALFIGLFFRMIGVRLCLIKTKLNSGEKLFCMIAETPKATVQAAIGGVALSMGLPVGELVLTIAVVAILISAPLGAFGIEHSYRKLLKHED